MIVVEHSGKKLEVCNHVAKSLETSGIIVKNNNIYHPAPGHTLVEIKFFADSIKEIPCTRNDQFNPAKDQDFLGMIA